MFNSHFHVVDDITQGKVATRIINEHSVKKDLKKYSIGRIKYSSCYSIKKYFSDEKLLSEKNTFFIDNNNLIKSEFDSVFEYFIDIKGVGYKLLVVAPYEFFYSSYIIGIYEF